MSYKIVTHARPMLDTGIGQEMGFDSDRAFLDHQAQELRKLGADHRAAVEEIQRDMTRRLLFGDGA